MEEAPKEVTEVTKEATKLDKPLLIVMLVLMVFGLIMVLSASSMASYMRYHNSIYFYFIRQSLFMLVGMAGFLAAIYFPTKLFKSISPVVMVILILSLFGLFVVGAVFNSSQS